MPLQLLVGVGAAWMTWRVTSLSLAPRDALVPLALWITYGLLPFYETKILAETLGTALLVAAVWGWSTRRFRQGSVWMAAGTGLLLGLATLTRANVSLSVPFFALIALAPWSADPERPLVRVRRAGALVAGAALVFVLNGAWNHANTGHFVPVILVSRTASVAASGEWTGDLSQFDKEDGSPASAWDVVDQARIHLDGSEELAVEDPSFDVWGWLRNLPAKLAGTFVDSEPTYQYGYFGERSEIRALDVMPTSFGVLLILGLAGAAAIVRKHGPRALLPYLPLVLGALATTTIFHPSSRYRLPMVVPLVLLSGHALPLFAEAWRRGLALRVGVVVIVVACMVSAGGVLFYQLRHPAIWELRVAQGEMARFELSSAARRAARARDLAHDAETRQRAEQLLLRLDGR